jgi:hypothetical protein
MEDNDTSSVSVQPDVVAAGWLWRRAAVRSDKGAAAARTAAAPLRSETDGKARCKYGLKCARWNCWYSHPAEWFGHTEAAAKQPPVPCRDGPACARTDCCYRH